MKRLLAFIALCLPLYLFAQGFGSFSHDQPFLAKDRVISQSFDPGSISNISYWWYAGDLTNGANSYWDDRINGARATNIGAGVTFPIKDTNGLYFASQNAYLSAGTPWIAPNVFESRSNWMMVVIMRPYSAFNGALGSYTEMLSRISPALDFQFDYNNSTVQPRLRMNATLVSSEYNNMNWQTLIVVNSNTPNQGCNFYTNGVISSITTTQHFDPLDQFGRANLDSGTSFRGALSIQEIVFYTNIIDITPYLGSIQQYVTNSYPVQGYSNSVELILSESLGGEFNTATFDIGFYFVPFYNMTVTALGRWDNASNNQSHTLTLRQKWDNAVVATTNITCTGSVDYKYADLLTPVTLTAHREYVLETHEISGQDTWRTTTSVTNYYADAVIEGTSQDHSTYGSTTNNVYGPVNFKYK